MYIPFTHAIIKLPWVSNSRKPCLYRRLQYLISVLNFEDCLFRIIFREKEGLLSLYNAMNGTCYTNAEGLEIYTIEDAVYMSMKNDSAFLFEDCLNLYEAQGGGDGCDFGGV